MTAAVDLDALEKTYPATRRTPERAALTGLTLTVQPGEMFGLLGPNGGGKTTLFRILSTALLPSGGSARLFGADVVREATAVRRALGVVFQNPSLDKKLTLWENLIHQGRLYGLSGANLRARAEEVLVRLSLRDRRDDIVESLSGGLQRRVEIAKGLLHTPRLLLLDEPSTGLDPRARREMWDYLEELKQAGVTIMVTTHLIEEGERCDRLAILHRGRCVALGHPAELKGRIGGEVVTVHTADPQGLAESIRAKFGGDPKPLAGVVRLEWKDGHRFIPQLVESFPGLVEAVTVGKPTLEDVFVHVTGESFSWDRAR